MLACPLLLEASGVSPDPREGRAMLQPLNVLSVSDDPIVKGEFTLHLFGFSYRNINQLEHALPIAVETA